MLRLIRKVLFVRRHGLLRLRPALAPARLECIGEKCGKCCRLMGGDVVVTPDEAPPLERDLVKISRTTVALRANGSACALLERGVCSKYGERPRGCRDYPWYNIGGVLYYDAGCPGIKFDRDERPDVAKIAGIETYYQLLHAPFRHAAIKLMTLW